MNNKNNKRRWGREGEGDLEDGVELRDHGFNNKVQRAGGE